MKFFVFLDDNDCIGYLNDWDKKIANLDVVDDYRNEKREIQARQGKQFPFSFGDVRNRILSNLFFIYAYFFLLYSMLLKFSWAVLIVGLTI